MNLERIKHLDISRRYLDHLTSWLKTLWIFIIHVARKRLKYLKSYLMSLKSDPKYSSINVQNKWTNKLSFGLPCLPTFPFGWSGKLISGKYSMLCLHHTLSQLLFLLGLFPDHPKWTAFLLFLLIFSYFPLYCSYLCMCLANLVSWQILDSFRVPTAMMVFV